METVDFYGTDRYGLAGVHPSERMSESETMAEGAIEQRARQLLAVWPDQEGVQAVWRGQSQTFWRD